MALTGEAAGSTLPIEYANEREIFKQCEKINFSVSHVVDKLLRAYGGCLGVKGRRRAWRAAISSGELPQALDPEIPEWGNPPRGMPGYPWLNKIGQVGGTGGTETS